MNKGSVDDLFTLSLRQLEESNYRFCINRARSVVLMDGSEFDDDEIPDTTDIYAMYNDPDRPPVLIAIATKPENKIAKFGHDGYSISYRNKEMSVVTYLREDALTILDEASLEALSEYEEK